jgi:hypothetical protein
VGGLRRWARNLERGAKESADTMTLLDTETHETFEVPRNAGLLVIANVLKDEEDLYHEYPWMKEVLPRLNQLVHRDNGSPFFLEDMTHTGKAASNTEEEHRGGVDPHFR